MSARPPTFGEYGNDNDLPELIDRALKAAGVSPNAVNIIYFDGRQNVNVIGQSAGGQTTMTNESTHVDAGGDVIQSAIGKKAEFTARDVSTYKSYVDNSTAIKNEELKGALKVGRDALENLSESESAKRLVLWQYDQLTGELEKDKPDKGILKMLWAGIQTAAKTVEPIVTLGRLIASLFGVELAGVQSRG